MTFITKTLQQLTSEELSTLQANPPTEASLELATRVGETMGRYAYPGDMVVQSVLYEAERNQWPQEVAAILGNLAYEGMQRDY